MKNSPDWNRCVAAVLVCSIILMSGCATVDTKQAAGGDVYERAPAPQALSEDNTPESGAYVVRARRLTKLELKKKEAVRQNDRASFSVLAGTIAAIGAYTLTSSYFNTKNEFVNGTATLAITAAAAYAAAWVASFFDDIFTKWR
jgi:uncharacterized protein YceK